MADDRRVFINGVDLSEFVKDVTIVPVDDPEEIAPEWLKGLRSSQTIEITGLLGGEICACCGETFLPSRDGPVAQLIETSPSGESRALGYLCDACTMAFVGPSDI